MKLSLRELARITGIAASTISRIENGHLSPTLDIVEKLTTVPHLEQPVANTKPIVRQVDPNASKAGHEQPHELLAPVVVYKKIGSTILRKDIRRDLSRIAARNGYEMAVVVKGTFQRRTNDGLGQNLKPGATKAAES